MKNILTFIVAIFIAMSLNAQTVTVDSVSHTNNSATVHSLFSNVNDTIYARVNFGDSAEVNENWTVGFMIVPGTTSFDFSLNNLSPSTNYVCAVFIYYDVMVMSPIVSFTTDACALSISISSVVLNSCSEQLTATGGFNSYQWKRNGAVLTGETDSVIIASLDGSYICVVGNTTCTGTSSAVVVDVTPITVTACTDKETCAGGSTTLTVTGTTGASYVWSDGSTGASVLVSPSINTTYTVTGSLNGCENTDQVQVKVNALPSISVTASATNICENSLEVINLYPANAEFTENGNVISSIFPPSSGIGPHDIVGTIVDNNGCENSDNITLNVLTEIIVNSYDYKSSNGILKLFGSFSGPIQIRFNDNPTVFLPVFPNDNTEATFAGINSLEIDDLVIVESLGGEGCSTGFIVSSVPIILFGDDISLKDKDTRIFDVTGKFILDGKEKSDLSSLLSSLPAGIYIQVCTQRKFVVVK